MAEKKINVKKNSHIEHQQIVSTYIKNFFAGVWRIICVVAEAIYNVLNLILRFAKGILLGIAGLVISVAVLMFAFSYFLKVVGISESPAFQQSRDFWITAHDLSLNNKLHEEFNEDQQKLPEEERYQGTLPNILDPKTENEKNLLKVIQYLQEQRRELRDEWHSKTSNERIR